MADSTEITQLPAVNVEEDVDSVTIIKGRLRLARDDDIGRRASIHRVRASVREEDPSAYDPQMVPIGPFHHGKSGMEEMEKLKRRFMNDLLRRSANNSVESYVNVVRAVALHARAQYSGDINLHDELFVRMMVLDGCFVVECLVKETMGSLEQEITLANCNPTLLRSDLLLVENQIPFCVVDVLFDASVIDWSIPQGRPTLIDLAANFFKIKKMPEIPRSNIHHLLHLFHESLSSNIVPKWRPCPRDKFPKMISCATELREAGINIKKKHFDEETEACLLNVTFQDGTLEIPFLSVESSTNFTFRNLIAFEQCRPDEGNDFTSYAIFLDNIINAAADVEVLRRCGVMENMLGSDDEVAKMFNTVCRGSYLNYENHYLASVFIDVKCYCKSTRHRWRAKLVRDYLNSPWAVSARVVALLLLIFMVLAIFTVLAYFRPTRP